MSATTTTPAKINGVDVQTLVTLVDHVKADSANGLARFDVVTDWAGGVKSRTKVSGWTLAGARHAKDFSIDIDEPAQLLGEDSAPNPQEALMAAMNACIMATYVALCSVEGINIERLSIETAGDIDLRGFLALDSSVKPGYDEIRYTVRLKCDGAPEQLRKIHQRVIATSPNYFNMANPITLSPELVIE